MSSQIESRSQIKSATVDDLRMQNYRNNMERKLESEVSELQSRHDQDIERLLENHAFQMEQLRNAYNVEISKEAEVLEERLHQVRTHGDVQVRAEKMAHEKELSQQKNAHQKQLDQYKKNSEAQIVEMRKQLQATTENLHAQAKKSLKKEKEIS